MIRNDRERSQTQEERERMARALEDYAGGSRKVIGDEETRLYYEEGVSRREAELSEYQRLKSGGVSRISGEGPNGLGTIITKARIARGMTLADLGAALEMPLQQVQRYESENWRRASLWRLQRVADVLALRVAVEARLGDAESEETLKLSSEELREHSNTVGMQGQGHRRTGDAHRA